jgi:hypothetical protein
MSMLVRVAAILVAVGAAQTALATESEILQCEAGARNVDAKFLRCAARCQRRAIESVRAGFSFDQAQCDARCAARADEQYARLDCPEQPERLTAPEWVALSVDGLMCASQAKRREADYLRCESRCVDAVDADGCSETCEARFDTAMERVAALRSCRTAAEAQP